ncbi:MAG: hypothetical protein JST20_06180 [Bacteroidetes bacterium]|nr:hypothetical protein [Bacteroidota bacterium]
MKSFFFFFLFLTVSSGLAQSGKWERINKINTPGISYEYSCISCCNDKNCIAVGNKVEQYSLDDSRNGVTDMFQRTTDGGMTWTTQGTPYPKKLFRNTTPKLLKVKMIDSLHIVAVGDSGRIVTTSDGGENWIERDSKTTWKLNDVAFYDSLNGMAVGYSWTYRITSDGGVTWQERPPFTNEAVLKDVEAPAPHTYYLFDLAYTKMFRTFDDGATWDSTFIFKSNLLNSKVHIKAINCASFSDTLNGWVAGVDYAASNDGTMSPFIARTRTGGVSWKVVYFNDNTQPNDPPLGIFNIMDIFALSSKKCLAVGSISAVLYTDDGGETWRREERGDSVQESPLSVGVLNTTKAILVANNGRMLRREFPSTGVIEELNGGKSNQYFWITTIPIPATSYMEVSLYGLFSVKDELVTAKVFNMLGVEVGDFSREANAGNNGSYTTFNADVSKLGGGVYVLQYSAGGYSKSGLFVVAR